MHQSCTRLQAELHATMGTADIHVLNIRSLGEMLDVGSTVEHGLDGGMSFRKSHRNIIRHIAVHHLDTGAEELLIGAFVIVKEQVLESMLSGRLVFSAHNTGNGRSIGFYELAQHMNTQIASSTRQKNVTQLLTLTL